MTTFSTRLKARARELRTDVCVGIDPRFEALPASITAGIDASDASGVASAFVTFGKRVIELTAPTALAVKPQVAFFEALGAPGYAAMLEVCAAAREAGVPVIADIKRGDIGSTATAYAKGWLAPIGDAPAISDAVTVNPYLGDDGIVPFRDAAVSHDGGLFVLVRTSNPSSSRFQIRPGDDPSIADAVADAVMEWNTPRDSDGYGPVGAVVGATHPTELAALRERMRGVWILIPGFGAQGGGADDVAHGFDSDGTGALVNASRSITFPWMLEKKPAPSDWEQAIARAASETRDLINAAKGRRSS